MRFLITISAIIFWLGLTEHPAVARTRTAPQSPKSAPLAVTSSLVPDLPPILTSYAVYLGGVHLLNAEILFQEQDGRYRSHVHAHTYGFWDRNLTWDTSLDVHGRIDNDKFLPVEFNTVNVWKDKPKVTKLHFDGVGNITPEFDPPNTDQNREIVTAEQSHGAYDPVSGLLQMLAQVAVEKNCNVTVPIFDGKRRFDITGKDEGSDNVNDEGYGIYKGRARQCSASFAMIAGDWKEKDHVGNGFWRTNDKTGGREPFHIWLASLAPELPELPVRMQSGSLWGLIMVHLADWHYATPEEMTK